MNNSITKEIKSLTFFRFITAFIVFIFHIRIHLGFQMGFDLLDRFILQGAIFMSAFFMLSGFILFFVYHKKDFSTVQNRRDFYIKRIAKIYPSYVLSAILAFFLLNNITFAQGVTIIPMTLFCLQSLFYSTFPYLLNGGLWSLSVEAVFYCLFPFIQQFFKRIEKHYKLIMIASYFAAIYPSVVQCYFTGTGDLYVNPLFRIPEFIFGMCISHMYINCVKIKNTDIYLMLSLPIIMLVVGLLSKNKFFNHTYFINNYSYYNCTFLPLCGIFMYSLAITENKLILKITNNLISNYLGKISYAFYLTQFIAIEIIGKKYLYNQGLKTFIITFVVNVILASVMYECIEEKYRKRIINIYTKSS